MANRSGINVTETSDTGAQLVPKYHKATHDIVGVPVMEIKDAASSALEEVLQFSFGNFLASGAFWLGSERLITVGKADPLFLMCLVPFACGILLAIIGFRQARRRTNRLVRYVPVDDTA